LPVVVPADFEPGAHQLIMTLTLPGATAADAIPSTQPLTVVPGTASHGGAADQSGTTEEKNGDAANPHETKGGAVGAEENILTHGLQSIADVAAHPGKIPAAFAIGLVLLLFAVLPAHLLNATLAEQYERFTRRVPALRRRPAWFARLTAWLRGAPVLGGVLITTITAILFGFADPRFGFTLASLRLILSLAIALAIVVYGVNALTSLIMRRRWNVAVQLSLRPLGLLLTVVGVVISRLLDFSPGFLIGLVLGLTIAERAAAKYAWRAILVRSGLVMGIAIIAWLGFSIFSAGETEADVAHFGNELFLETLVAIVTEGIVALLIELLPFRLLEGERLYRRSRVLWGAVYLLALVIFIVAVVPWEGNWATLGSSLWVWIAIVAGFGIVCTGIYLYFRFFAPPLEGEDHPEGGELVSVAEEE
ncbi:MAG TPA: hypothetical protein VN759_05445, partial [Pseudolysinimonas sp.]|nr:hypothetical protein [Pseudolysinimonas sp.]